MPNDEDTKTGGAVVRVEETLYQKQLRLATTTVAGVDADREGGAGVEQMQHAIKEKGNDICCDCDGVDPTWVILPWGGFVCTKCAGVHRSLGVHISFVQSLELDELTEVQLTTIRDVGGNHALNDTVEYHVPPVEHPKPSHQHTHRIQREKYIRDKYEHHTFHVDHAPLDPHTGEKIRQGPVICETNEANETEDINVGLVEYSGMLNVTLFYACHLSPRDMNMKSDPYVVLRSGQQHIRCKTIEANLNPNWNESLMLCWEKGKLVTLMVYDEDLANDDDFMGSLTIDITDMPEGDGVLMRGFLVDQEHKEQHNLSVGSTTDAMPWTQLKMNKKMELTKKFVDLKERIDINKKGFFGRKIGQGFNVFGNVSGYVDFMMEYTSIDH